MTTQIKELLRKDIRDAFQVAKTLPTRAQVIKKEKVNGFITLFVKNLRRKLKKESGYSLIRNSKVLSEKDEKKSPNFITNSKYNLRYHIMKSLQEKNETKGTSSEQIPNIIDPSDCDQEQNIGNNVNNLTKDFNEQQGYPSQQPSSNKILTIHHIHDQDKSTNQVTSNEGESPSNYQRSKLSKKQANYSASLFKKTNTLSKTITDEIDHPMPQPRGSQRTSIECTTLQTNIHLDKERFLSAIGQDGILEDIPPSHRNILPQWQNKSLPQI